MSIGELAGLIAACAFAVLVIVLAVPLLKLGRLLDETREAVEELSDGIGPIVDEAATAMTEANRQLQRVDTITTDVAEVTTNVSSLVAVTAAAVGRPLIWVAGATSAVTGAFAGLGIGSRAGRRRSSPGADR